MIGKSGKWRFFPALVLLVELLLAVLLLAGGCAGRDGPQTIPETAAEGKAGPAEGEILRLMPPHSFGRQVSLLQQVEGRRGGQSWRLLVQIEILRSRMTVVGLNPLGQRLFTLTLNKDSAVPEWQMENTDGAKALLFNPLRMMQDIQIVIWPALDLNPGYVLEAQGCCNRTVTHDQQGPVISITYQSGDRVTGKTLLIHHDLGYQLSIETLAMELLDD